MSEDTINKNGQNKDDSFEKGRSIGRRDMLQGLATVPVLGVLGFGVAKKISNEKKLKNQILDELGLDNESPAVHTGEKEKQTGTKIRIGLIGHGIRGSQLMHSAGFPLPQWLKDREDEKARGVKNIWYQNYLEQEDLNIVCNGICDVFDVRAQSALERAGSHAKRYRNYREMLASDDIDAVIIATPDHWHAQMAIDAARAGKHVYVEKCMTNKLEEAYTVRDEVKKSGIKFQLGHQNRQTDAFFKAKEIIDKGILGNVNLIETTTNRNSPGGAWVYDIHPEGNEKTIDWAQFIGPAPMVPFSLERFFRWRCWFAYGTGLAGDLLTHEYDALNQILGLGIPKTAISSGGVYHYKDGRDVPDVWQVTYEYPDKNLTFFYSATLASNMQRGKKIMGSDGYMDLGQLHTHGLRVYADRNSERFKSKIENGTIDLSLPLFTFQPGVKGIEAVTSASQKYFLGRGLMYTYRGGKMLDPTYLHIKEWLNAVRNNGKTSCNIDRGFEEAITAHMSTKSYHEGRRVTWDHENEKAV